MASHPSFDPSAFPGISAALDPLDLPLDSLGSLDNFAGSAPFTDLALDEDPLFPADWDQETPPEGNLYSTPLSWDEPKVEPLPLPPTPYTTMNTLTPAQQEKLRKIAMPSHLQYRGQNSPNSTTSGKSRRSISSPETHDDNNEGNSRGRKRKSSASDDEEDEEDEDSNPPAKKTAHNMIEKRYRVNLNDKIAALRESVPSLRIMRKSQRGEDTAYDRENLQGLQPAHKLNKATILAKATEYIQHLEKRNKRYESENKAQKARLNAFETLFRSGSMGFNPQPMPTYQFNPDYNTPGPSPIAEVRGMIPVPEDMRRLHGQLPPGQPFAVPQQYYPPQQPVNANGWGNNNYLQKMMIGGLASLMLMEGYREYEQEADSPNARGLSAVPVQFVRRIFSTVSSSTKVGIAGYHVSGAQIFGYLKLFLGIGALLYVFLPSLFANKPTSKGEKEQSASLAAAPSLASPIEVRRQAWLTAVQTVWVPRHSFILELWALSMKSLKLGLRSIIGASAYCRLTGTTEQQEAARVKAWDIALDAQLAGGDGEVNKRRLALTLLASKTLPDTPIRLMLKALHMNVLMLALGNAGLNRLACFQKLAASWSRAYWNQARLFHQLAVNTNGNEEGKLPSNLAILLEQDCDEVLMEVVTQRAYNLTWNLPTTYNATTKIDGIDGVVDDHAIRSPLDAVAAWYSCIVLQRALSLSLEEGDAESQKAIGMDIALAIKTAPIGSLAQIRALVARAVLVKPKRGLSIAESMRALGMDKKNTKAASSYLVNSRTSVKTLPDIKMAMSYAIAIAHLDRFPPPDNPSTARQIITHESPNPKSLLGFAAAFKLMESLNKHDVVAANCTASLERLAGTLRIWIGSEEGVHSGLEKSVKKVIVERCLGITKRIVGMEDDGYESMPEGDDEGC